SCDHCTRVVGPNKLLKASPEQGYLPRPVNFACRLWPSSRRCDKLTLNSAPTRFPIVALRCQRMTAPRLLLFGIGCLLALAVPPARAEDQPMTGFLDRVHKDADGKEAKYVLFVPKDYDAKADKTWPVILFLHGAGETQGGSKQPVEVGIGT